MEVLKPTQAQLEHGLELHKEAVAGDTFGFLPVIWTPAMVKAWNELKDGHIGARELEHRTGLLRAVAATQDEAGAREFIEAIEATGLSFCVQTVAEGKSREEDIKRMATSLHLCRVFRKHIFQAGCTDDIRRAKQQGRMAVIWSVNGPPVVGKLVDPDEELSFIDTWYQLGVRLMHLTYNRRNVVADGCAEPADGGLSEFGKELVGRLNRVGIIVDTPHSGRQTTLDAAHVSERPVMASHTGCEAHFKHIRCKSDEELKAIAETDGLVGIFALPSLLGPDGTLAAMLDHIDYAARLIGTDHVSIGTDTTYSSEWPPEVQRYENARFTTRWWGAWNPDRDFVYSSDEHQYGSLAWVNWPLYTVGLVTRGYSDDDIRKMLGLNFMRVLDATRPESEVRCT